MVCTAPMIYFLEYFIYSSNNNPNNIYTYIGAAVIVISVLILALTNLYQQMCDSNNSNNGNYLQKHEKNESVLNENKESNQNHTQFVKNNSDDNNQNIENIGHLVFVFCFLFF